LSAGAGDIRYGLRRQVGLGASVRFVVCTDAALVERVADIDVPSRRHDRYRWGSWGYADMGVAHSVPVIYFGVEQAVERVGRDAAVYVALTAEWRWSATSLLPIDVYVLRCDILEINLDGVLLIIEGKHFLRAETGDLIFL
jgi:hypothetical protein